jgi:hydroxyacylglutathione hydrolase
MVKKIFSLAVFLLAVGVFSLQSQVFKNDDLKISKLEDKVWVVETSDNTTMYIIEGNDKALLVDTGTRCANLGEVVRKITDKPLYVVLTHIHGDHAGNIFYFDDIYFHKADSELLSDLGRNYDGKIHYVEDGYIFDLGGKEIEVSHMPAHTPGSIVLLDRKAGICYSGDAFGSGQVWLQVVPVMPINIYVNSLKKMEKLMDGGISKIYCGHYPYVKKYFAKDYIIEMLELADALDKGTPPNPKPYPIILSSGTKTPMLVTKGQAGIVYDPDHLK